jgi:hypothetical protein
MHAKAAIADIEAVMQNPSAVTEGGSSATIAAAARYYACVCRYCPPGSPYRRQADRFVELPPRRGDSRDPFPDQALYGVLAALKEDIANAKLATFEEMVRADVYGDLLGQAAGLLRDGKYYRAATIIAGAALEEHLKKLAAKHAINIAGMKAAQVRDELKKAGAFPEPQRASIDGWQKLRNEAAHANPGFEGSDTKHVGSVEPMLMGIQAFIAQYPA